MVEGLKNHSLDLLIFFFHVLFGISIVTQISPNGSIRKLSHHNIESIWSSEDRAQVFREEFFFGFLAFRDTA